MEYAEHRSLRNYLKENLNLHWYIKIINLHSITSELEKIHEKELIHRDLYIGNIVVNNSTTPLITDMGLCKPANYNELENAKKSVYGVLPYIAPEILQGKHYTKASDIYGFGIIWNYLHIMM